MATNINKPIISVAFIMIYNYKKETLSVEFPSACYSRNCQLLGI